MSKDMLKELEFKDYSFVNRLLPRIKREQFENKVNGKNGFLILDSNNNPVGFILYVVLWEKLPFIEHLIIDEAFRNKGYGTKALLSFEKRMKDMDYKMVLLSTQVDERAQFLYRRLGYVDNGALFLENTPFDQPAELFLKKKI